MGGGAGKSICAPAPRVVRLFRRRLCVGPGAQASHRSVGRGCTILGADYLPNALLHAIFTLHRVDGHPLHELVKIVSFNAARAIGQLSQRGQIAIGRRADMALIFDRDEIPRITATFVDGRQVYASV